MKNVVLTALVLTASASISNAETFFNQRVYPTVNHGYSAYIYHSGGYKGHIGYHGCGGCRTGCGLSGWGGRGLFGHGCCPPSYSSCKRRCDLFAYFHGGTYCTNFCSMGCSEGLNYLKFRIRKCCRELRYGCSGCSHHTGCHSHCQMGCGCHGGHSHGEVVTPTEAESNQEELNAPADPPMAPMDPMDPQPTPPLPPAPNAKSARVPTGSTLLGIVF